MIRSLVRRRLLPLCASAAEEVSVTCSGGGVSASFELSSAALQPRAAADGPNRATWGLSFSRGSKFASGYSALTQKPLDTLMKVESVKFKDPEEITQIWNDVRNSGAPSKLCSNPCLIDFRQPGNTSELSFFKRALKYHIGRRHISAVMASQLYDAFEHRAKACPFFVIPVKRGMGYITLFMQAQMPHLLFTGLGDYQARGADATPYLTVTHYDDFAETKKIVLVRGDVVLTSKLTDAEARMALEAAHSFYLNDQRYKMVQDFNRRADEFEFREVLKALGLLG